MMRKYKAQLCAATTALIVLLAISPDRASADSSCPVSLPEAELHGQKAPSSLRWFGSDALAVLLPRNGTLHGPGSGTRFTDRLFWLAAGFKPGMEDEFYITGRRLDVDEPATSFVRFDVSNARHESFGGWAVLTAVGFPAPGCWKITGRFQGQTLSFVTRVADIEP